MPASTPRRLHRLLGLLLLLPMLGWCVTGLLFHLKPGWSEAYAQPSLRFLPHGPTAPCSLPAGWLETRRLRTVLGEHLLVHGPDGRRHLDPATGAERPPPSAAELRRLLTDALDGDPRYGAVERIEGLRAETSNGIVLELDWERLALSQRGRDTALIDALYRVHYLQWTGVAALDRLLGGAGLLALFLLALLGARLAFARPAG